MAKKGTKKKADDLEFISSQMQRKFLEALTRHDLNATRTLSYLDITRRTFQRWLLIPAFKEAYEKRCDEHLKKQITSDKSLIEASKLTIARAAERDAAIAIRILESLEPETYDRSIRKLIHEKGLATKEGEKPPLPRPVMTPEPIPEELKDEDVPS